MLPMFAKSGICFAFAEIYPSVRFDNTDFLMEWREKAYDKIMNSTATVLVFYGGPNSITFLRHLLFLPETKDFIQKPKGKVWIFSAQMEFKSHIFQRSWDIQDLHGAISFSKHSNSVPGFHQFLQNRNPSNTAGDGFIREFWGQAFGCVLPDPDVGNMDGDICTEEEKLEDLPGSVFETSITGTSYSIYNAVYAVAHAFYAMHSSRLNSRGLSEKQIEKRQTQQQWQVISWGFVALFSATVRVLLRVENPRAGLF